MNFSFEEKNNILFSKYLNFCIFGEYSNFKLCYVIIEITHTVTYTFDFFG